MSSASESGRAAGDAPDAVRKALAKATASIRIEGDVVHREKGGIAIRRGGSVFEAEAKDIIEVRQLEGGTTAVLVKADAQLIRSTVVVSEWFGGAAGWRPVFDDCADCCDCTECSVCADCTECSVCTDCTECSVCIGDFGGLRGDPARLLSAWIKLLAGSGASGIARMSRLGRRAR